MNTAVAMQTPHRSTHSCARRAHLCATAWAAMLVCVGAQAQVKHTSAQGSTGGLVIPSAEVLDGGQLNVGVGNFYELPLNNERNRPFITRDNYVFGIGLYPQLELTGRLLNANYPTSSVLVAGYRDISFNAKYQLPNWFDGQPRLAVGANDVSGNGRLRSLYAVASGDAAGYFLWRAGYAKGRSDLQAKPFDGAFAGVELPLGNTGVAVLAEYASKVKHFGARYTSAPIHILADARFIASIQQSSNYTDRFGRQHKQSAAQIGLNIPLYGRSTFVHYAATPAQKPLPPASQSTANLERLVQALHELGLERVRVGKLANQLIVEYENHRYQHNEADAIGIVLGLAAELAPSDVHTVSAATLKNGIPLYTTSVPRSTWRDYLRAQCDLAALESDLDFTTKPAHRTQAVEWLNDTPTPHRRAHLRLAPELNHTIGTELGVYDYSLGLSAQLNAPLWRGYELQAVATGRLADSGNVQPGKLLERIKVRSGLKSLALQRSGFLTPNTFVSAGVGKYQYDYWGSEAEVDYYLPQGVARARAGGYLREKKLPSSSNLNKRADYALTYRHHFSNTLWAEAGYQKYASGQSGPSLDVTRWFGDTAVHLFLRQGAGKRYGGLEFSLPLTPRSNWQNASLSWGGAERWRKGILTSINSKGNPTNFNAPRDFAPAYDAQTLQLNSGRLGKARMGSELLRMRDAFFTYGRDLLP